jgi:hypothetical protein
VTFFHKFLLPGLKKDGLKSPVMAFQRMLLSDALPN